MQRDGLVGCDEEMKRKRGQQAAGSVRTATGRGGGRSEVEVGANASSNNGPSAVKSGRRTERGEKS